MGLKVYNLSQDSIYYHGKGQILSYNECLMGSFNNFI